MTTRKLCKRIESVGWTSFRIGFILFIPCSFLVWLTNGVMMNGLPLFAWSFGIAMFALSAIIYFIDRENCQKGN
jgi:hypothetical protein